jgi:hypothetical protein
MDAPAIRVQGDDEAAAPCSECGWKPEVTEIVEIIVHDRAEIRRLEKLAAEKGFTLPWTPKERRP